jgi:hypothetical protein
MGPTKKPNQFLRIKSQTGVPNKLKFSGTLIFWFTNMKTVFKNGVPNKPTKSKIFLPNNTFFLKLFCQTVPFEMGFKIVTGRDDFEAQNRHFKRRFYFILFLKRTFFLKKI